MVIVQTHHRELVNDAYDSGYIAIGLNQWVAGFSIWPATVATNGYVNKLLYQFVTVCHPNRVGRSQSALLLSIIVIVAH